MRTDQASLPHKFVGWDENRFTALCRKLADIIKEKTKEEYAATLTSRARGKLVEATGGSLRAVYKKAEEDHMTVKRVNVKWKNAVDAELLCEVNVRSRRLGIVLAEFNFFGERAEERADQLRPYLEDAGGFERRAFLKNCGMASTKVVAVAIVGVFVSLLVTALLHSSSNRPVGTRETTPTVGRASSTRPIPSTSEPSDGAVPPSTNPSSPATSATSFPATSTAPTTSSTVPRSTNPSSSGTSATSVSATSTAPTTSSTVPVVSNSGSKSETAGTYIVSVWSDFHDAGGKRGPRIKKGRTVQIACRVRGYVVPDGDPWWYQIASAPWDDEFYVSADPFYNDGATSGPITDTPPVDTSVRLCAS